MIDEFWFFYSGDLFACAAPSTYTDGSHSLFDEVKISITGFGVLELSSGCDRDGTFTYATPADFAVVTIAVPHFGQKHRSTVLPLSALSSYELNCVSDVTLNLSNGNTVFNEPSPPVVN